MNILTGPASLAATLVSFDSERYRITPGETFPVRILISPVPTTGLFSFGVRLNFLSTHAVVTGVSSVEPISALFNDGATSNAPLIAIGHGFAAAKGTADFFSPSRPISTNALLVTFHVRDLAAGPYELSLEPFNTLGPSEEIFVDGRGGVLDADLVFGRSAVLYGEALAIQTNTAILLNRQTGLFEQIVRVSNNQTQPVPGLKLSVTNLPSGWQAQNAHGQTNGMPFFLHRQPLLAGAFVDFRVEYRIPGRNPAGQPVYLAEIFSSPEGDTPPSGDSFVVVPRTRLPDGAFLLEFPSLRGRSYLIQYSYDLTVWHSVQPAITGNGTQLQWLDYGPPKTDSPPAQTGHRYYRVFLLP